MIKKILSIFVLSAFLAGCTALGIGTGNPTTEPTMSDSEMSTRVAQILTSMPTMTQSILQVATVAPTATKKTVDASATAKSTSESAPVAETPELTSTATQTPTVKSTQTSTATATGTATSTSIPTIYPTGDPRGTIGTADWTDAFNDGSHWPIDEDTYSIAKIESGMLVFTGKQKMNAWRLASAQQLTDAYIEVIFKTGTCSGKDGYGIYFRVPDIHKNDKGYLYGVTCDGQYNLKKWDGTVTPNGKMTTLVDYTTNSNINSGSNQTNRVGVMSVGSRLMLYVNGVLVSDKTDTSYASGFFGLFVHPVNTVPLTVRVDEASYWLNPTIP